MKKIHHGDTHQKSSGLATLISDKIGFKIPVATRHKVGHFIMIEVWNYQEDIKIINNIHKTQNKIKAGKTHRRWNKS